MTPLEESRRWANRAEENRSKAAAAINPQCRATWHMLAQQSERWSERALTYAIAFDAALRRACIGGPEMLSKSGLHPYQEGLFFLLSEFKSRGPKSRAAVLSGDLASISERAPVRMLAKMFNKQAREVARELVKLDRSLENGTP